MSMNSEDFAELLLVRQSDRKYEDRQVPIDAIERIVDAARLAPSANNSQPWSFVVIRNEATRLAVSKACTNKFLGLNGFMQKAPTMIVVVEERPSLLSAIGGRIKEQPYTNYDVGIAVSHMTLAAAAEGLGSCIVGWLDSKKIAEILGIPASKRVVMIVLIGYSVEKKRTKKRKALSDILHYDKW